LEVRRALSCAVAFAALASADQVVLKNGDRITGAVVKKDEKSLTVKTDLFGTVTVDWDKIESLRTDKPVTVQLSGGEAVKGELVIRDSAAEVAGRQVPAAEVAAVRDSSEQRTYERLLRPSWLDLWAGNATFGFAGTSGNADTMALTLGTNATRVTRGDKTAVYFNAVRASALVGRVSATTAQAVRGGWAYSRNLTSNLFVNTFNDYENDRFQSLDLRFVLGGGFGYIAWKGERGRLDVLGGGAFNRESFAANEQRPAFIRRSGEAYFGDDFTWKMNSITSVYQNLRVFPNVSTGGEYRLNFDSGVTSKLLRWLTWNAAISNRYLSNPAPGRQQNDILYTTGLGITFSR
jgi:putative salt-induced outer membrane protein